MPSPLDGARERLKRANENIQNLNREITAFLAPIPTIVVDCDVDEGKAIITDKDRQSFEQLRQFITTQVVPPRFGVLTGEIVHHMRSAFDHLAWQLSSANFQAKWPERIEFPVSANSPEVCATRNIAKHKPCHYCRKIEGIASPTALARIDSLQPYRGANPLRNPLWLIHNMDRIDKHRELILAIYIMQLNIVGNATIRGVGTQMPWERRPRVVRFQGIPQVEMKAKMSTQVTLSEFRGPDDQPIIPTLQNLLSFTIDSIESFAGEFA